MKIQLPDHMAGTKDALFVLDAEFSGASEQRMVQVETTGPIEALDLRGNSIGGVYVVPIGTERLHVPMRVKGDGGAECTVTVRCTSGPEAGQESTHTVTLDAPATVARGARPGGKLLVAVLVVAGLGAAGAAFLPRFLSGPTVPNVERQTQAQAERSLRDAGYLVQLSNEGVEDADLVDRVVRTIPPIGEPLAKGESVELVIGIAEDQSILVPNLLGKMSDAALNELELEDLQANEQMVDVQDPKDVGRIVRQSPQDGAYVPRGTVIDVYVGRARPDVTPAPPPVVAQNPPPTDPNRNDPDPVVDPDPTGPTPDPVAENPPTDVPANPAIEDDPRPAVIVEGPTPEIPSAGTNPDDRTVPLPNPSDDTATGPTDVTEAPPAVDDGDMPGPGPERDGSADGADDAADEEPELVIVPGVKGMATAEAEKKFDEIGLFAIVDYEEVENPGWDGKVLRQSPEKGVKVAKNTQVFLVVGRKRIAPPADEPKDEPVPPKDEPTPPKDEPTPPKDEPVAPKDEPVAPKDEPAPPKDEPVAPKDEPVAPKDEPTPPKDEPAPKDPPVVPGPRDAPPVQAGIVPDLVAQSRAVAEGLVRKAGFYYQIELEVTGDLPEGQVLSQEPAAGEKLAQGGTVKLIVARAPLEEGVEVPNVIGRTRGEATRILRNESFLVRVSYGGGVPSQLGRVTDQAPPPGTRAPRRSWVEIVVASGSGPARAAKGGEPELDDGQPDKPSDPPPDSSGLRRPVAVPPGPIRTPRPTPRGHEPAPPVRLPGRDAPKDQTVPTVEKTKARDAIEAVLRAGLVPILEGTRDAGGAEAGTVVAQSPATGTKQRLGDLVRLKVTLPVTPGRNVFIPNALGSSVERMRQRLAEHGIRVEIIELDVPGHPYAKTRRVAGQYPAGTTARDYASIVTVWVIK